MYTFELSDNLINMERFINELLSYTFFLIFGRFWNCKFENGAMVRIGSGCPGGSSVFGKYCLPMTSSKMRRLAVVVSLDI